MKKIGIAVFALMFGGAAYLGAQETKTDFAGTDSIQSFETLNIFVQSNLTDMGVCIGGDCEPDILGNWPKK
jgi:hypothetical protein